MGNKWKAWRKCRNRNHHRGAHTHSDGSIGDRYSKAPKFYRKEAVEQDQKWLAKMMKGIFRKKG
jgi:hypothetical protein